MSALKRRAGKWLCRQLLLAICLLLPFAPAEADNPAQNSLLMPRVSESLLLDVVQAGDRLLAVGEKGHVLFSDDNGARWRQAQVPTRQMLTAIYFTQPQRGWAVGHDGLILASVDGGEHWVVQRDGLVDQVEVNRQNLYALQMREKELQQTLMTATAIERREALMLDLQELEMDLEDAQFELDEAVHAPPLLDVFFLDDLRGFAIGAFNTLLCTVDGGASWQLVSERLDNPEEFHLNAITGNDRGTLWIAAEGGLLFRSADSGASWQTLPSPYRGSWFGIVRQPANGVLLVFGLRGHVFRSEDDGSHWQPVTAVTERSLAGGQFISERYALLVGAVGTLLVSTDGGVSFTEKTLGNRLNLSAAAYAGGRVVLVGQGGIHQAFPFAGGGR